MGSPRVGDLKTSVSPSVPAIFRVYGGGIKANRDQVVYDDDRGYWQQKCVSSSKGLIKHPCIGTRQITVPPWITHGLGTCGSRYKKEDNDV